MAVYNSRCEKLSDDQAQISSAFRELKAPLLQQTRGESIFLLKKVGFRVAGSHTDVTFK